jgi:hypothetical protein
MALQGSLLDVTVAGFHRAPYGDSFLSGYEEPPKAFAILYGLSEGF